MKDIKILIADDFPGVASLMKNVLIKNSTYTDISIATSSKEEMEIMKRENFDIVITDIVRKGEDISGLDIILQYAKEKRKEKFIIVTASSFEEIRRKINAPFPKNIIGFIQKYFDWSSFAEEIENIIDCEIED